MKILKILSDSLEESKELIKILGNIKECDTEILEYKYVIPYFDGMPNNNFDGSFINLYKSINNDKQGLTTNFIQLTKYLEGIFQIYDILLLIDPYIFDFEKEDLKSDVFMYKNFFITITYFDGGFWEISCKDQRLLENIKNLYVDAEWIEI